jgi:hypothetical protein
VNNLRNYKQLQFFFFSRDGLSIEPSRLTFSCLCLTTLHLSFLSISLSSSDLLFRIQMLKKTESRNSSMDYRETFFQLSKFSTGNYQTLCGLLINKPTSLLLLQTTIQSFFYKYHSVLLSFSLFLMVIPFMSILIL